MKSFQAIALFAGLALAQDRAVPPQIEEIVKFLPTSLIAANTDLAKAEPAAWATLQAKMHSVVAADEAFFQTYSQAVPGFGGLSALIATQYNTALLTGEAAATSTSDSTTSTSTSKSSTTTSDTTTTSSTTSDSSTITSDSSTSSASIPTLINTGASTTMSTSTGNATFTPGAPTVSPTSALPPANAAPTSLAFGVYGAAVVGVAGLAALL